MRLVILGGMSVVFLIPTAFAQRPTPPNPIVNNSNILHPAVPPVTANTRVLPRTSLRGGAPRRTYGSGTVLVPYPAYIDPFYGNYGAGYGPGYGPGYDPASGAPYGPQGYDPGYQQPPPPTIIINQNFQTDTIHPQIRDYSNVPLPPSGVTIPAPQAGPASAANAPPPGDEPANIFLIALKDQSVVVATGYWVKGDTLGYVTMNGAENQVSLALVDRDLSMRLNAERQVQFKLPPAR